MCVHYAYTHNMSMTKLNLYITKPQREALEKLSKKTGLSVAELVRRFVDAGLKEKA
jgi:hypothetical protein